MQTLAEIKALLASRGLAPRKAFGQNFLVDKNLIGKLVDSAELRPGDLVLEIGPGTGALTEALLERSARVVAVELDRGLAALLRERAPELLASCPGSSLTIIEGDCLAGPGGRSVNPEAIAALAAAASGGGVDRSFRLIANLPYGAATPLLLALLIHHPVCRVLAVTIQREVAERLAAPSGTKAFGTLGIVAQAMAEIRLVASLPPECFWPRPDVTSAMVLLTRRAEPLTPDPGGLAVFCQELFSKRRKQLAAILGRGFPFPGGILPEARPDTLTVPQLIGLHNSAKSFGRDEQG